jgi:hypothetical protein
MPRKKHHTNRRNHVGNQIRTYNMKAKITSWIKRRLCTVLRNQWAGNLHLHQDTQNNILKPKLYYMYHQVEHSEILYSTHTVFACF